LIAIFKYQRCVIIQQPRYKDCGDAGIGIVKGLTRPVGIEQPESDRRMWSAFNVGSGNSITINEIATTAARLLSKNIAPQILNHYRVGDIRHCFADISKMSKEFGFQPQRTFNEGMGDLVNWVATTRKPIDRSAEELAELVRKKLII